MELNALSTTKIVCTLGPVTSTKEMITKLVDAGMNVARLNFSHGTHENHAKNIQFIRQIAAEKNIQIAILQDLHLAWRQLVLDVILAIRGRQR